MALQWRGFYRHLGHEYPMEFTSITIELQPQGKVAGAGSDDVGAFSFEGCFHPELKLCRFTKSYHGQHEVYYQGIYDEASKTINGHYGFNPGDNNDTFQLSH
jgi:hypothetical protein